MFVLGAAVSQNRAISTQVGEWRVNAASGNTAFDSLQPKSGIPEERSWWIRRLCPGIRHSARRSGSMFAISLPAA